MRSTYDQIVPTACDARDRLVAPQHRPCGTKNSQKTPHPHSLPLRKDHATPSYRHPQDCSFDSTSECLVHTKQTPEDERSATTRSGTTREDNCQGLGEDTVRAQGTAGIRESLSGPKSGYDQAREEHNTFGLDHGVINGLAALAKGKRKDTLGPQRLPTEVSGHKELAKGQIPWRFS